MLEQPFSLVHRKAGRPPCGAGLQPRTPPGAGQAGWKGESERT